MKLSQFNFPLTIEQVAKYPARYRDESKLMVLHKDTGEIEHKIFKDIINYTDEGDVFVFNDTKVFPARLNGTRRKQVQILKYSCLENSIRNSAFGMFL